MQKLKVANLYQSELITISGKLVERYNACLELIGHKPTNLTSFSIDGIGWSPEIAEEKQDMYYLNHGDANPHALIVSPQQKGKPVYVPTHSFDRAMMKEVFRVHELAINDITRDCALCLSFDQNIDAFYEPLDILKYDTITIRFRLINDLDTIQDEQLALIDRFHKDHNFIDESIHAQLLESAKTYGDLRQRKLKLEPVTYTTESFFTKAFGGIYVLKDFISTIVVFEDEAAHKEAIKDTIHDVLIYHVSQPELIQKLRDHLIVECDLEKVIETKRYQRIKKVMFANELGETEHAIEEILEDRLLTRRYLNTIDVTALKRINGVEIYLERLQRSNAYKIPDLVNANLYEALHQPHSSLETYQHDLIWKLLVNISPLDILYLYWYDKEQFYKSYSEWEASYQNWAIATIRNNI